MANVTHSTIADAYKHEPKGISGAADFTVYRSDGAGSGSWGTPFTLLGNLQETSASSTTAYEIASGFSGYQTLFVVIPIFYATSDTHYILQIDNSGTYRTSGYEGGQVDDVASTADNFSSGFFLWENRSSVDYAHGVWRLDNCDGGVVTCSGVAGNGDVNFYENLSVSTNDALDFGFGRQTTASTVTKLRIVANNSATIPAGYRFVQVWGIR